MGYIITLGQTSNTYTGFRAATADMEVGQGEYFMESLEGWEQEALQIKPTPASVLKDLEGWAAAKGSAWGLKWAAQIGFITRAFAWWGDANNQAAKLSYVEGVIEGLRGLPDVTDAEVDYLLAQAARVEG